MVEPVITSLNDPFWYTGTAPGIPSDWSDLTDYINTLKAGRSCHLESGVRRPSA